MRSTRTTLKAGKSRLGGDWELIHRTAGEEVAGAGMVTVTESWGAIGYSGGASYGRWFNTLEEATAYYESKQEPAK